MTTGHRLCKWCLVFESDEVGSYVNSCCWVQLRPGRRERYQKNRSPETRSILMSRISPAYNQTDVTIAPNKLFDSARNFIDILFSLFCIKSMLRVDLFFSMKDTQPQLGCQEGSFKALFVHPNEWKEPRARVRCIQIRSGQKVNPSENSCPEAMDL